MTVQTLSANTNSLLTAGNAVERAWEGTRDGAAFTADYALKLSLMGRSFSTTGAAANTKTGALSTSFVDTTPSLLLDIPTGTVCMPQRVQLVQTATVGGGAVQALIAVSRTAIAYSSGGSVLAGWSTRNDAPYTQACTFYLSATATTALLTRQVAQFQVGPDVSTAEGADNTMLWTPKKYNQPLILVGPASFGVFCWSTGTGVDLFYSIGWSEVPSAWVTG